MWVSFARMKGRSYSNNINNNQGFLVKMKNINNNYYYFVSEHVHSLLACYSQSFILSVASVFSAHGFVIIGQKK